MFIQNLIRVFLFFLVTFKEDFYKSFEDKVYQIYSDMISFIDNPNCSCRIKVAQYVREHNDEIYIYVENWLKNRNFTEEDNKIVTGLFQRINEENKKNNESEKFRGVPDYVNGEYMAGKIVTISDDPEEFYNLISYLKENNFYYNHFSVVKSDNNNIKIYFA